MRVVRCVLPGRLFVALLLVVCHATAQQQTTCTEWQVRFSHIQATWMAGATPRSEVERVFGLPLREEKKGACTYLHYATTGCSCSFAVCTDGAVVSKTFTIGAAAVPALITSDPAALAGAIESLQESLREMQNQISRLQQAIDGLAPAPLPSLTVVGSPPVTSRKPAPAPAVAVKQCAALTSKGVRCSRHAAAASSYCWQHRR